MKILKKLKKLFTKSSKNKTFSELKKSDIIWFETDMGRVFYTFILSGMVMTFM